MKEREKRESVREREREKVLDFEFFHQVRMRSSDFFATIRLVPSARNRTIVFEVVCDPICRIVDGKFFQFHHDCKSVVST